MSDASPPDPYAQQRAWADELHVLAAGDDPASRQRRFALHMALAQEPLGVASAERYAHAEQARAIATQLDEPLLEAQALHLQGRVRSAELNHPSREQCDAVQALHEAALRLRETQLGPDHPEVAASLLEIVKQGSLWAPFDPYAALAERAVAILERALGPDDERTCEALGQLARMLRIARKHERSLPVLERLLATYTSRYGPDDKRVEATLEQIVWARQAMGDNVEAATMLREMLARRARAFGDLDDRVLRLRLQLWQLQWSLGAAADAKAELTATIAKLDATLGPEHPATLTFLVKAASLLFTCGASARAQPLYERAIAAYERAGAAAAELTMLRTTYFSLLWNNGDTAAAQAVFEQLLAADPFPPMLVNVLRSAAYHFVGDDEDDDANHADDEGDGDDDTDLLLTLHERLLAAYEQRLGPGHADTIAARIALAEYLMNTTDDPIAAIAMLYQVLAANPTAIAHPDSHALALVRALDEELSAAGDYDAVAAVYRRLLELCAPAMDAADPVLAALRFRLGTLPG